MAKEHKAGNRKPTLKEQKGVVIHFDGIPVSNALADDERGNLYLFTSNSDGGFDNKTEFAKVTFNTARRWFKMCCALGRRSASTIVMTGEPDFFME